MNLKLLKTVLSWQAESRNNKQQQVILDNVKEILGPKVQVSYDTYGNMYMQKGSADVYPCIVAHVDQVHRYSEDYHVLQAGDVLLAFDSVGGKQVGVGGDDKCGIYLLIQAVKKYPAIKAVLFKDEEVGCLGSGKADLGFFSDCAFIVQGDRRHTTNDCINHTNGVSTTSTVFDDAAADIRKEHGYVLARGTCTDIGELVSNDVGCCAMNIACGYYNAHSSSEFVRISKLEQCEQFIYGLFDNLAYKRWEHIAQKYKQSYFPDWGGKSKSWGGGSHAQQLPAAKKSGTCKLCSGTTQRDFIVGDEFCPSCNLFSRDIEYWEQQLKLQQ